MFFRIRVFERYMIVVSSSSSSSIARTMNLGYINVFFSSRKNSISRLSLSPSLSPRVFIFFVCQFLFYFFLFYFLSLSAHSQRGLYIFFIVVIVAVVFFLLLFLLLTVILNFVCLFFLRFLVFICTSNFHQINLWWAHRKNKMRKKQTQMAVMVYTNRYRW